MGIGSAVAGDKMYTTETIECIYTSAVAGWEPPPCHKQMASAPIFTAATLKSQDHLNDNKWQNRVCVNLDAAA